MTEPGYPEPNGLPSEPFRPTEYEPVPDPGAVIVVRERPSRGSARFLPPILIALAGASFLTFRAADPDWQGFGKSLFGPKPLRTASAMGAVVKPKAEPETPPAPPQVLARQRDAKPAATLQKADEAAAPPLALRTEPVKPLAPEVKVEAAQPAPVASAPKPAAEDAEKRARETAAAWNDIEREAEATRRRQADLERVKREADRVAEIEKLRREERKNDRRKRVDRQGDPFLAAQKKLIERQTAWMAEIQRQHLREFADMERRFRAEAESAFPGGFPPALGLQDPPPPEPRPGPAPRGNGNLFPGGGLREFQELRDANGKWTGFRMRWRPATPPAPPRATAPRPPSPEPPPPPRPQNVPI